jgi:antirestriction protein ArdC
MSKVDENRGAFAGRAAQSLENGTVPWRQEGLPAEPQQNGVSGRSYSGLNALFLMEAAGAAGYTDPRWLTRKEAENNGFKARTGEKSTKLEFWDKDEEGNPTTRTYSVFNIQQFYGQEKGTPAKAEDRQPNPAKVEEFFKKAGVEPPTDRGTEGCQRAVQDLLVSNAEKSETLRKIPSPQLKDLRMSIAGTFLMQEAGIPLDTPVNAPTKDWAKTLRLNPKELFRAAKDAVKLTNEILGRTKNLERPGDLAQASLSQANLSQTESSRTQSSQTEPSQETGAAEKSFEPEIGQRVTFQPHDGKAKLTGKVLEMDETSVTLQCGRTTIPALREKGTFTEAPELDRTNTKDFAKEQAQKHVGEQGSVFTAKGEDALYKGVIVELTSAYAIQKVGDDAILHRLKDLESCKEMIREGAEVSIAKGAKGAVTAEPWNREQEEHGQNQAREGVAL